MSNHDERLAINGGAPVIEKKPSVRQRWGEPEMQQLQEALKQPSLFYWNGAQTKLLRERFREYYPLEYVMPCSSGTAALHIAVAAAGVGPGDEVITTPITDMGTVIGVLYQGGVPVFADLQPHSFNLDVGDVEKKITPKTKAIIAVHLTGNPCDLDALKALADSHDLILIEDCAQAWGALYRSTPVGTIGHIGCWSLNDFKHIGCGDGGIVASNDARFGPLLQKFGDKDMDRVGEGRGFEFLAPNYRISELQSAFAAAQMTRMWDITGKRGAVGRLLNELLQGVPGLQPHGVDGSGRWTCWYYLFRLDPEIMCCTPSEFAEALNAEGVGALPYSAPPIYRYPVFQDANFLNGRWPTRELGLTNMDYKTVYCREAEAIVRTTVQIPVDEGRDEGWTRDAACAVRKVAAHFSRS